MSAFTDHEKHHAHAHHYAKYAHEYNAVFAYDKEAPKFNESAPLDSKQWSRLEVRRGNDRTAYSEWKEQPGNTSLEPSATERRLWEANADNRWNVLSNHPTGTQSTLTDSPWLDIPPAQRNSLKGQAYLQQVEAAVSSQYKSLGSPTVDEKSFVQGGAAITVERQQAKKLAQTQQGASTPQQATPAAQQATPAQQAAPHPVKRTQLSMASFGGEPAQPARSRIDLDEFTAAFDTTKRSEGMKSTPKDELTAYIADNNTRHAALNKGPMDEAGKRATELRQAREQQVQRTQEQSVSQSQTQVQKRTQVQSL